MFTVLKNRFGLLLPIMAMFILSLAILSTSRLALSLWQIERVNDAQGWFNIILSGLRIDISTLCYLLVVPGFLSCLLASNSMFGKFYLALLRIWLVLALWFMVYMEISTVPFILEYDARPNRLFVEYLIYPKEVLSMLFAGYKIELLIATLASALTIVLSWRLTRHWLNDLHFPAWRWRPVIALVFIALCFIGARSTTEHRPLNPAMVAFSTDPLVNDLTLNSAYSLMFAVKQMSSEANAFDYYGQMDEQELIAQVQTASNIDPSLFTSLQQPTLSERMPTYKGRPKNLVILLQESLGSRYVGKLGGLPLTPNIDKLMEEGWYFTRLYATGTRSVRGIEAVVSGFTPTPARAVVKLGKSQANFFTIAELLKSHAYHTQFIYGGESHFDNMKSFFLGNGFMDMQDLPTFEHPEFVGSWGVSDEDLYNKAHQQFTQLAASKQAFFSLVFTSSNHSPFEYPEERIEAYNSPKQSRENAAKYSDYALGEFVKKAKKSNYWQDTIFIVVADHDSRAFGNQLVPIDHFKIPAVIFGQGIEAKKDERLSSQIDLAPTLLSLIGITNHSPMIGHDMTQDIAPEKLRAMMQFYKNFAWMDNDNHVVILPYQKPELGFVFDPVTLTLNSADLSPELFIKAKAHALWGSLAYEKSYYQSAYLK